jgi:hypothetical protein
VPQEGKEGAESGKKRGAKKKEQKGYVAEFHRTEVLFINEIEFGGIGIAERSILLPVSLILSPFLPLVHLSLVPFSFGYTNLRLEPKMKSKETRLRTPEQGDCHTWKSSKYVRGKVPHVKRKEIKEKERSKGKKRKKGMVIYLTYDFVKR